MKSWTAVQKYIFLQFVINLKLINFHNYFACHEKMDSDEKHCDVNKFYHQWGNCNKVKFTSDMMPENTLKLAKNIHLHYEKYI